MGMMGKDVHGNLHQSMSSAPLIRVVRTDKTGALAKSYRSWCQGEDLIIPCRKDIELHVTSHVDSAQQSLAELHSRWGAAVLQASTGGLQTGMISRSQLRNAYILM